MWLIAVSLSLLPAIIMASSRYGGNVSVLGHLALAWALRFVRGRVCVRSTHAFVFSNCTHGKVDSVLETFHLYAKNHPSLSIGPEACEVLDDVIRRVRPSRVLELGMHCGYSAVRMLRLLSPAGWLTTVEQDPLIADLGEEILLVAGFKHSQFQVLTSSSAEAIPTLHDCFDLVLMDHNPQQYLPDLWALEREGLLCRSGCTVLLVNRKQRAADLRKILEHIRVGAGCFCIKNELPFLLEVFYQNKSNKVE